MATGEIMTTREAAEYLHLPAEALTRRARRGSIPGRKVGRHWRFRRPELDRWVADRAAEEEEYERIVDQGLLQATLEAMADPENQESIPWEQVKRELGL
jgi:excisionase family DNA binding protein